MATTVYKGAYLPTVSGDSGVWGTLLNTTTFPVFDSNLGGIVTKTLTNANVTLSASESENAILRLIGTLSGAVQITTAAAGFTFVENATTGAFAVTITNGAGTPATIPQGVTTLVITDATNGARTLAPLAASSTTAGIVQLATVAETQTGTNTTKAVTPADVAAIATVLTGAIIPYFTETPPSGWLECNGAAVSRTTYATLFAFIGTRAGAGDGSTTFNVPDLRGYFMRGWDHAAGNDPNAGTRTDSGDGTSGDHVGTKQADALAAHIHTYTRPNPLNGPTNHPTGSGRNDPNGWTTDNSGSTGGSETRPKNINVMYCIKT